MVRNEEPAPYKRSFGAKSALDYLIGEKLVTFADAAEDHPEFAKEFPKFLAAVGRVFNGGIKLDQLIHRHAFGVRQQINRPFTRRL